MERQSLRDDPQFLVSLAQNDYTIDGKQLPTAVYLIGVATRVAFVVSEARDSAALLARLSRELLSWSERAADRMDTDTRDDIERQRLLIDRALALSERIYDTTA